MATPTSLRNAIAVLTREARRDLFILWKRINNAADAEAMLHDVLPALIDQYGLAAATVAAEWYDELRASTDAKGRFRAIPVDVPDSGAHRLVGWAAQEATDLASMRTLVEGGTQRRIANFSRLTVSNSSVADPQSVGWKRIGAGSCDFCRMLIARDQTYTEATADFASHDHCNCQAYPLIKGAEPIDVKDYAQSARTSKKPGESDAAYEKRRVADRARVREYLATH